MKGVESVGHTHQRGQPPGRHSSNHDADYAVQCGQDDCLDQELQQHLMFQRADGEAQADLAGDRANADDDDPIGPSVLKTE